MLDHFLDFRNPSDGICLEITIDIGLVDIQRLQDIDPVCRYVLHEGDPVFGIDHRELAVV